MQHWSERELLDRLALADNAAARELVGRYERIIVGAAVKHRIRRADLDDLIQSVWLALLAEHRTIRTPEALPGWIRTTAHRLCVRLTRQHRTELCADLAELPLADERPGPEQLAVRADRAHLVRTAFATLPQRCRRLLTLDLSHIGYAEIGGALALAEGSIGPTRRRCLDRLRARLAEHLEDLASP
ncbi:RNA polymerase sigma factor [Sciscionella marina]|uniref:RNA polymerase sigma factor n=1 Tax=Sciscionella marina TaxID=508770 RepID=UPI00035DE2F6|nr:sigma-70 family RNA polymerase sigma factor [Sciscionella marina]